MRLWFLCEFRWENAAFNQNKVWRGNPDGRINEGWHDVRELLFC